MSDAFTGGGFHFRFSAEGFNPPSKNIVISQQEVEIMSFGIKPLGTKVVLKKIEAEEKTEGGIILASAAKAPTNVGEVVAVGPGTDDEKMVVSIGERVVYSPYASSTTIEFEGEDYLIMRQSDLLAVLG